MCLLYLQWLHKFVKLWDNEFKNYWQKVTHTFNVIFYSVNAFKK